MLNPVFAIANFSAYRISADNLHASDFSVLAKKFWSDFQKCELRDSRKRNSTVRQQKNLSLWFSAI
jgi:hypothetical protein